MSDPNARPHAERDPRASPPPPRPREERPPAAGAAPHESHPPDGPRPGRPGTDQAGGHEARAGREDAAAARISELENERLLALADLDNVRKRCAAQVSRTEAETTARVARLWLPVVDNLERALAHAEADPSSVVAGIEATREQALAILSQLGFARRDDLGDRFDPARHEAVASRPDASVPEGSVVEVVQPGYGGGESQLRPARVIVAKAE